MGVNKFMKFLSENKITPKKTSFSDFSGKSIAIDMSILIHRIINASKLLSFKGKITTHIFGVFMKMYEMKISKINIIAVFDGEPPEIKKKNEDNTTENVLIEDFMICDIKKLLKLMGIQIIQSIGEADTQCAYLSKKGIIDAVYSRDTDMLIFGCDTVLLSLSKFSGMKLELHDILEKLNITQSKLIDIANILGNDYFPGIKNIGIMKVLKINNVNDIEMSKTISEKFRKAKDYYLLKNVRVKKSKIEKIKPEYSLLFVYLVEELGFNKEKTKRRLDVLKSIDFKS